MKVPVSYTNAKEVGTDASISSLSRRSTAEDLASALVNKIVPGATFRVADNYVGSNGVAHIYFKQTANGLDIDNGDFNVNVSQQIWVLMMCHMQLLTVQGWSRWHYFQFWQLFLHW